MSQEPKHITATPTRYKSTIYRSKSEAVFARCLDLSPIVETFVYESTSVCYGDTHDWDFTCFVNRDGYCGGCGRGKFDESKIVFIEYKPSPPTDVYISNLIRNCEGACNAIKAGKYAKESIDKARDCGIVLSVESEQLGSSSHIRKNLVVSGAATKPCNLEYVYRNQQDVISVLEGRPVKTRTESYIVWGNPWSGRHHELQDVLDDEDSCYITYPIFTGYGKYGWGDFIQDADNGLSVPFSYRHPTMHILGITSDIVKEAMMYRFDLHN